MTIPRATISELETGRRKVVTVPEVLILAAALDVPPVALVFPDLPDGVVESTPGEPSTSIEAVAWFSGEVLKTVAEEYVSSSADETAEFARRNRGSEVLRLSRERFELRSRIETLVRTAARLKANGMKDLGPLAEQVEISQNRIDAVEDALRAHPDAVIEDENHG